MAENYNPADHSVDEVKAYVKENPAEAKAVLEAESARGEDSRSTLVSHLEKVVDGQQEAPVPAEPKAVTVAPADQSDLKDAGSILGKDYEVSPDRGYRVKRS